MCTFNTISTLFFTRTHADEMVNDPEIISCICKFGARERDTNMHNGFSYFIGGLSIHNGFYTVQTLYPINPPFTENVLYFYIFKNDL